MPTDMPVGVLIDDKDRLSQLSEVHPKASGLLCMLWIIIQCDGSL